jgi:hypothetical protein
MTIGRLLFALLAFSLGGWVTHRLTPPPPDIPALLARVASHGVPVTLDPTVLREGQERTVLTSRPFDSDLARCLPWIDEELGRYPAGFLRRLDLRVIVLCRRLNLDGDRLGGIAMAKRNAIGLEVDGNLGEAWARRVVHHELFHVIDARVHGGGLRDDDWDRLNAPEFGGYLGDRSAALARRGGEPEPGFVTHYALTEEWEDRAELFSFAVMDPVRLAARAKRDRFLARKLARVETLAAREPSCLGPEFWARRR